MLSISSAVVVEQLIVSTNLGINLVHIFLNNCRKSVIVWVAGFSCLEEDIRVLSRASLAWMIWIQCMLAESIYSVHVNHFLKVLIIPGLNLLNLMGCTETVEEVDEWNLALDGCHMCNNCQVHYFLYTGLAQHSASGLTACVNVGMVTENR